MTRSAVRTSCIASCLDFCRSKDSMTRLLLFLLVTMITNADAAETKESPGTRLKELVSLEGVRDNQLIGYGLVVGLKKTGDNQQTLFSAQSVANLLQQMGVSVNPTAIQVNNTASVMVTATLPPFAQPGMHIDVNAAAMGNASNLQGGVLLMTSLKGVDGQVYAISQGSVITGGFDVGKAG